MRTLLALPPVGAEAGEVERTQRASVVDFRAGRAEGAEAAVVVRAGRELGGGVDVQVEAFVAVAAVEGPCELVAFGHAASAWFRMSPPATHTDGLEMRGEKVGIWTLSLQVVLVQEFALVALLAQAAQPVLADEAVEGMVHLVLVRAVVAQRAVAFAEGLA